MRRGYQLAKWKRRAETAHRKLVELADEIQAADGDQSSLFSMAASAHCEAHNLVSLIEGEQQSRSNGNG